MKRKATISIPEPCDQKWSNMTPNLNGRHCDKCDVTLLDFSILTDAQIIERLRQSGPVCVRARENQLARPLSGYPEYNSSTLNLRAVAMGLGLLISAPSFASHQEPASTPFNLVEILLQNENSTRKEVMQQASKIEFTILNAYNGYTIGDMELVFLNEAHEEVYSVTTDIDGQASVKLKKLNKVEAKYIKIESDGTYEKAIIPIDFSRSNMIIKAVPDYSNQPMIIGMVHSDIQLR